MSEGEPTPGPHVPAPSVKDVHTMVERYDRGEYPPLQPPDDSNLPEPVDPFTGTLVTDEVPAEVPMQRNNSERKLTTLVRGIFKHWPMKWRPGSKPQSEIYKPNPEAEPKDPWAQQDQSSSVTPPTTNKSVM